MTDAAIRIRGLTKRFGDTIAVDALDLDVAPGSVCGLLGHNGAGKTTTLRCLLDLVTPTAGRAEILGLDCRADSVAVRSRVGFVPEDADFGGGMRVGELVRFTASFYDDWDAGMAAALLRRLELPERRRLRTLSRGMRAKVGLVLALAARPRVLLLDDPTSGLDPLVRREFLEAVIADAQAEGVTVLFSTHLLHEMERIADDVAILDRGRLVVRGALDALKASYKRLRVVHDNGAEFRLPGVVHTVAESHHTLLTVRDFDSAVSAALRDQGAEAVEVLDMSLEEIFVDTMKSRRQLPERRSRQVASLEATTPSGAAVTP